MRRLSFFNAELTRSTLVDNGSGHGLVRTAGRLDHVPGVGGGDLDGLKGPADGVLVRGGALRPLLLHDADLHLHDLERVVQLQVPDLVRFPDLSLSIIKLLGSGEYTVERAGQAPEGHFGLAVRDYTHSTAPNRRFPDLITQRLLKAALAGGRPPYSDEEMEALAAHCTEQEDAAKKVERRVRKAAAALMLAKREGDTFNGIVTGASEKGTWVRIFDPPAEGKVVRGESGMDVGERVRVRLVDTDPERGYIDFAKA